MNVKLKACYFVNKIGNFVRRVKKFSRLNRRQKKIITYLCTKNSKHKTE